MSANEELQLLRQLKGGELSNQQQLVALRRLKTIKSEREELRQQVAPEQTDGAENETEFLSDRTETNRSRAYAGRFVRPGAADQMQPEEVDSRARLQERVDSALAFARGDADREAAVVKAMVPDAIVELNEDGRYVVTSQTLGVTKQPINAPGASRRDATQVGAGVATGVLTAIPTMRAASWVARLFSTGGAAAADSAAQDLVTASATSDAENPDDRLGVDAGDAAIAGAVGGTIELGAIGVATLANVLRSAGTRVTPQVRRAAEAAGLNIDDLTEPQRTALAGLAGKSPAEIQEALAGDLGAEFGLTFTKARRTGSLADESREAALRRESPTAFNEFDRTVSDQQQGAARRVAESFGPDGRLASATESQAGGTLRDALVGQKAKLESAKEAAYTRFDSLSAEIDAVPIAGFARNQRQVLDAFGDVPMNASVTPTARALVNDLQNFAAAVDQQLQQPGATGLFTSVQNLERMRRTINDYVGAAAKNNAADLRLVNAIKQNFDDFVLDSAMNGVVRGRDADEVLDTIKQARGLHAQLKQQFAKRDSKDVAGKIMEQIVDGDLSDQQVVRAVFGTSRLGGKDASIQVIKRIKEVAGEDSPAYQSLREAAVLRMFRPESTRGTFDPAVFVSHFEQASRFSGSDIYKELFTTNERALLNRFSVALRKTLPESLRSGHRFQGRIEAAISSAANETMRRWAAGSILQGKPITGMVVRRLQQFANEQVVSEVLYGRAAPEASLVAAALRPVIAGESAREGSGLGDEVRSTLER